MSKHFLMLVGPHPHSRLLLALLLLVLVGYAKTDAQPLPPELTAPVNDFTNVISNAHKEALDRMIRSLQRASGDVVVVATVDTFAPYGDIREYAVKMFENRGRGIGRKGKDNGLLVVLAVQDRQVRIEVGYDLEQFITDGFAGSTSREVMVPLFRNGEYGAGLRAEAGRLIQRVAQGRGVTLTDFPEAVSFEEPTMAPWVPLVGVFILLLLFVSLSRASTSRLGRGRRWGGGPWSGWNSGVGPFAGRGGFGGGGFGTFGGGFGGFGGGGGGFGGFGGGRSGGGGGGAGW